MNAFNANCQILGLSPRFPFFDRNLVGQELFTSITTPNLAPKTHGLLAVFGAASMAPFVGLCGTLVHVEFGAHFFLRFLP